MYSSRNKYSTYQRFLHKYLFGEATDVKFTPDEQPKLHMQRNQKQVTCKKGNDTGNKSLQKRRYKKV